MKTDESETLAEWCDRIGCLLLAPRSKRSKPDRILQFNPESGLIEHVSTEGLVGIDSLIDNEKKLVTTFRKNVSSEAILIFTPTSSVQQTRFLW